MQEIILKNYKNQLKVGYPYVVKKKDNFLMLYNIDANNKDKMWDKKALGFSTYNLYTLYLSQPDNMLFTWSLYKVFFKLLAQL